MLATPPQEPKAMTRDQLKLLSFKQRVGELASNYEEQIADFRAEATQRMEAFQNLVKEQEAEIERLREQLKKYQDAEKDVQEEGTSEDATQ